jgi:hypothetical protein
LEKNMGQHKVNEKTYMYKLEVYHKNFPDFLCGNPASIETSGQYEENEIGPNGTTQEEEVQIKEPHILKERG